MSQISLMQSHSLPGQVLDPVGHHQRNGQFADLRRGQAQRELDRDADQPDPGDPPLLSAVTMSGDPQATLRLLGDPAGRPPVLTPEALEAYRAFLRWRIGGSAPARAEAVATILRAERSQSLRRSEAVLMLAALGARDEAFAVADRFAADPRTRLAAMFFDTMFLYAPQTAALRADPRFVPLADRLGLLAHWRESGHRPDFCQTQAAPVCDALASRGGRPVALKPD